MPTTPWFKVGDNPVRDGWYEVGFHISGRLAFTAFVLFKKGRWGTSEGCRPSAGTRDEWRGLIDPSAIPAGLSPYLTRCAGRADMKPDAKVCSRRTTCRRYTQLIADAQDRVPTLSGTAMMLCGIGLDRHIPVEA